VIVVLTAWLAVVTTGAWRWRPPPHRVVALCVPDRRATGPRRRLGAAAALVVTAALLALVWPPLAILALAMAWLWPRWTRRRAARRQRLAIQRGLPDIVDLLVVAIGAGLTPTLAVDHLAGLAPAPFGAAFAAVGHRVRRGQRLADALDELPAQLGDDVGPVARTIASAERYGTPLGPALDALGHEARRDRRRLAEEAARTLPVKLCFPLVGCILPAFVLLTIAPLVAGALRSLHV
jgi:Flp pilus assembly protein TadB